MATVDRTYENDPEDSCVTVILDDGFKVDFWLSGLIDAEYIRRAKQIQAIEKEEARGASARTQNRKNP